MAGRARVAVKVTANFEANLDAIERFLESSGAYRAYDALLDEIAAKVIPNLERFPKMGRPFLSRAAYSVEALERIRRLERRIGEGELREYVLDHHLALYVVTGSAVYLLAIKHHRQLSFEFSKLWQ